MGLVFEFPNAEGGFVQTSLQRSERKIACFMTMTSRLWL